MMKILEKLKSRYNLWKTTRYYRKMVKHTFGIKPYMKSSGKKYGESSITIMLDYQRRKNQLLAQLMERKVNNYIHKEFPETKDYDIVFKERR